MRHLQVGLWDSSCIIQFAILIRHTDFDKSSEINLLAVTECIIPCFPLKRASLYSELSAASLNFDISSSSDEEDGIFNM